MLTKSERLNILSSQEQLALYGLPDFDDSQRMEYFIFTEQEMARVLDQRSVHAQVYCALQIGYFKACSFLKIHQATMRSNTATREFFVGLPGLGQTLSKSSLSAASAISRRTSEKAKLVRPFTLCRRSGSAFKRSA